MQHMTRRPQPWTRREALRALAAVVGTTLPAGSALAHLVDLTSNWIGRGDLRKAIHAENPVQLYGF